MLPTETKTWAVGEPTSKVKDWLAKKSFTCPAPTTPAKTGDTCWASVACIQLADPTGSTRMRNAGAWMSKVAPVALFVATVNSAVALPVTAVLVWWAGVWAWVIPMELSHCGL